MSTDAGQSLSSLDGLSSILAKMCDAQVTLTHSVNELVMAQKTTNELIGTLIKDRTAGRGEGTTAEERMEDTTNEHEEEQNTGDLRRIAPDLVLNPVAQVIATFELLEQILLDDQVSMRTVLFAQRVNTTFLATIANSKSLQRKLFLAPQPSMAPTGIPSLNPLLEKVLGSLPLWFNPETKHITRMAHQATAYHISLKKLEVCELRQADDGDTNSLRAPLHYVKGTMYSQEGFTGFVGHGSWERMLLAQPPCASLFKFDKFSSRKISYRNRDARTPRSWIDTRIHDFSLHFATVKDVGGVGELLKMFAAAQAPPMTSLQHAERIVERAIEDGEPLRCDTFGRGE
ncbi:hypothetical protein LTS10_005111 [Elasticomyces elasticus]|nr:hypothetical protein LTS10_005111 [Elasticomyces elasticus]